MPPYTPDDGLSTSTSRQQRVVEEDIQQLLDHHLAKHPNGFEGLTLNREAHIKFIEKTLRGLGSNSQGLDPGRPWLFYWPLNSLALMDVEIADDLKTRTVATLARLQRPEGGYGGPDQLPHLAATYAAVLSLAIVGTPEAFASIDRMKQPDGSFTAHRGGEVDVRGSYCAIVIATLLNLLTPELTANVSTFIARCQTYEGGIGSRPNVEAHSGYAYCGLATLAILNSLDVLDIPALLHWSAGRQMTLEGGFNGRTNKLVDGCYSFWAGATFPLLESAVRRSWSHHRPLDPKFEMFLEDDMGYLYDRRRLQEYILGCCQATHGGLRDKPEKFPDPYHTCYVLAGLAASQHRLREDAAITTTTTENSKGPMEADSDVPPTLADLLSWTVDVVDECVLGPRKDNLLRALHPIYAIPFNRVTAVFRYFYGDDQVQACL
ncbi:CAAX farnesyltransferase (FTase) subunit beta [Tieghemiomyces parasiticus]|uniref:Protein farnesyltransferase subunit beta n=1 Tax=Tieghemiomyces parasiticus TaxID=78921 RepID=A0A9W8AEV7_9FUNG|nr:CAAX farnesyltransferase (FTase) subunit beta [Tieghemiomyces parasiticus]